MLANEYEQAQKEFNAELEDPIENGETQTKDLNQLLVNVLKYADTQELTAQMVNDLVDKK
jgi:chemotaxis regulatin CheY-phosphate phosphatase CheZ